MPVTAAVVMAIGLVGTPAQAASAAPHIVALGDSFTALGAAAQGPCARDVVNTYPVLLAQQLGGTLNHAACSGATTTDVINNQLSALTASADVVVLTAGGNDVDVFAFIGLCIQADCAPATKAMAQRILAELPGKLRTMYAAVKAKIGPDTKVFVGGYPLIMSPLPTGGADPLCQAFAPKERLAGVAVTLAFEAVFAAETRRAGPQFQFVSALRPGFLGYELCGQNTPKFYGSEVPGLGFHPNNAGHKAYAPLFAAHV